MPGVYGLVAQDKGNRARGFVLDRSWRYLRETVDFSILRKLESDLTPLSELVRLGSYLKQFVGTFNDLFKAAVDARDEASFAQFVTALDGLLRDYHPDHAVPDHFQLELRLESEGLTAEERKRCERRLDPYRALVSVREETDRAIEWVWFGISGWLVRERLAGRVSQAICAAMLEQARNHFDTLERLSALYLPIRAEGGMRLGWDNWVLSELPEGYFHWIDTESWLGTFYCIQGLRLTSVDIGDEGTPVVPDRQWEHMLESLEATCKRLQENSPLWQGIVSDDALESTDSFLELHRRAAKAGRGRHERWLIEQPISEAKWQQFRQGFLDSWRRNATMRALVTTFGIVEDRTREQAPRGILLLT